MLIYNIKTQVRFHLGYNPLIFDGVMGLFLNHSTNFGVRSITFERLHRLNSYFGVLIYINTQVEFDLGYNPLISDGVMGLL